MTGAVVIRYRTFRADISLDALENLPARNLRKLFKLAAKDRRTNEAAIKAVIAAGYDEALVYDRKPKTLSELEKLMGKAEFAEKIGSYVVKPLGKPTLALATDKREVYNPAAADFAGVVAE